MKKLITEADILQFGREGKKEIYCDSGTIFTPLAVDRIRSLGISIIEKSETVESKHEHVNIALGCDHTGLDTKNEIVKYLKEKAYKILDHGTYTKDSCDYPDFAFLVAKSVALKEVQLGIIFDATGIPSAITANKVPGIRAATVYDTVSAKSAKEHNDANVIVLGAKTLELNRIKEILDVFLNSKYEGGRHQKRLDKIKSIEEKFIRKK
ncbi:MAG: ribose 5-phosphate isomerase B [bacterium]